MSIIKGTTPTIQFTYSEVNVEDIATAFLVIKQDNAVIIEKPLSDANVQDSYIEWKLTQEDTLKLRVNKKAMICCDWKLLDGTRGRSHVLAEWIEGTGKNEVI